MNLKALDQKPSFNNMGNMNYKDLTNSDWDRINAEINKLKK